MASKTNLKQQKRSKRKVHIRKRVEGSPERPRVTVYRSARHIYAQVIDDVTGKTIVSASTMDKELRGGLESLKKKEAAAKVGELLAQRCLDKGVERVVFDRNGYTFRRKTQDMKPEHLGRIESLAHGMRNKEVDGKKLDF